MSEEYNKGKLKPLIKIIAGIIYKDRDLYFDYNRLIAKIEKEIPILKDKTRCANCEASMSQYIYNLNVIDTVLIIGMAKVVRENTKNNMSFNKANRVHVPTLPISNSERNRTSRCAKLGLIARYKEDGKHKPGTWVITRRGFAGLRGEKVPSKIIVWRGRILEKFEKEKTFNEIKHQYKRKVKNYIKKHNKLPNDSYHDEIVHYNKKEWISFGGLHKGNLF